MHLRYKRKFSVSFSPVLSKEEEVMVHYYTFSEQKTCFKRAQNTFHVVRLPSRQRLI